MEFSSNLSNLGHYSHHGLFANTVVVLCMSICPSLSVSILCKKIYLTRKGNQAYICKNKLNFILFIYFFNLFFYVYSFIFFNFIFKLYIIVLVLPNIIMNPPQVYMCSPS